MKYWLVKQEAEKYSFDDLIIDGTTLWDGVRNYQARNNLRLMKVGDHVLFYHSVSEMAVVGVAEVTKSAFQDSTDETGTWSVVEIKPLEKLENPVTLKQIKALKKLKNVALIKQSRLSVMPLRKPEYDAILKINS
jgi:predicted RNA-binding protein with PUA-like domain